jgi:pre-mRNA-processing factor 19
VTLLTASVFLLPRALASVQASVGIAPSNGTGDVEMDTDGAAAAGGALPAEMLSAIETKHAELSAARKKRKAPAGSATLAEIKAYTPTHTIPSLHSPSPAGITALALSSTTPGKFVTGGNDKVVQVYDRNTDKVLGTLKGHSKKINRVAIVEKEDEPTMVISASADKTARVWAHDSASDEYIPRTTVRVHKGEVTGLAVHPLQTLFALGSRDGLYSVHDLRSAQQLYVSPKAEHGFESLTFHPDGALLGAGSAAGTVLMYDVRAGELAAELGGGDADAVKFGIHALGFSENGYQLLAPSSESTVAVWDLRNQKAVHTFDLGAGFGVSGVGYDPSAKLLGISGTGGLRVFAHKTWEQVVSFEEGGAVADFAWGGLGKELWGATGREVRIWGTAA